MAPDDIVRLSLERVHQLAPAPEGEAQPPEADVLKLHDGSAMRGKFMTLTETLLRFDIEGIGPVEFPRQAVEARLPYTSVAAIAFPLPEGAEQPPAEKHMVCGVDVCHGARLVGRDPRLEGDRFALMLVGDQRVSLPVDRIVRMTFTIGGTGARPHRILVWACYSELRREYPRTMAILQKGLGRDWQIEENFNPTFDDAFRRELDRTGTLLVPEMEKWDGAANAEVPKLKQLAESLLPRGGTIDRRGNRLIVSHHQLHPILPDRDGYQGRGAGRGSYEQPCGRAPGRARMDYPSWHGLPRCQQPDREAFDQRGHVQIGMVTERRVLP